MRQRRRQLALVLYLALIVGGIAAGNWLTNLAAFDIRPGNEFQIHQMIILATIIYIVAAAIPFVPGAEVGFGLILMLGSRVVALVYFSMVAALILSYLVGRLVPAPAIARLFSYLGLSKAADLALRMDRLDTQSRLALLTDAAPPRLVPFLLRHRFLALALAINLPGNTVLGGGGGLAMAAGMSRLFPFVPFLVTVILAVSPLPTIILLTGYTPQV